MTFQDINNEFTYRVQDMICHGLKINAGTMVGSQGEIAHVDFASGMTVYRVLMERFVGHGFNASEGIRVVVGRCADRDVEPRMLYTGTVWNKRLEITYCKEFYKVGECNGADFYGTMEEAEAAKQKRFERYKVRRAGESNRYFELSGKVLEQIKDRIKREQKLQRVTAADIKAWRGEQGYYYSYRGKTVKLH